MKTPAVLLACAVAIIVTLSGAALAAPLVFAGRVLPGVSLGETNVTGLRQDQLGGVIAAFDEQLREQPVILELRGQRTPATLGELGVSINREETARRISNASVRDLFYESRVIMPHLTFAEDRLSMSAARLFPNMITPPQNASLTLSGPELLTVVPSRRGERVSQEDLEREINQRLQQENWSTPIQLTIADGPPAVDESEVEDAKQLATELLTDGVHLIYGEEIFQMKPSTIRRMLMFAPRSDPGNPNNQILGVKLDPSGIEDYLANTLAPEINQQAENARFVLNENESGESQQRVTQFSLPEQGQTLNIPRTIGHIAVNLARNERTVPLAVDVTNPEVTDLGDIEELGLTALLAAGKSDFVGSPKNRIHNITVGASRYHGLLLPPGKEFSFNEFLGPVDGEHGFLPELVIKSNVTTPEYGGGLCQVSTTVFRAALNAGLEITDRRNHAYAVTYYGTPGLDATIYPPYTDLKFKNNTPGYMLIQTVIDGTELSVEFWGTNDNRLVQVDSPVLYDRQPDGAIKAYVKQKVTKDGEVVIDETFYSRYRSPKLFPKVLSANGEAQPTPTPTPAPATPTLAPSQTPTTPAPNPASSNAPAV